MIRQDLHDGWQLTAASTEIPDAAEGTTVPTAVAGSTHVDLPAAGPSSDSFADQAQAEPAWTRRTVSRYTTTFTAATLNRHERVDLVFDGLGAEATVELNGRLLGDVATKHRGYRFDIRDLLTRGGNDLTVSFSSTRTSAEKAEPGLDGHPQVNPHPFNTLLEPVRLERWHLARLARVRPVVTVSGDGTGQVEIHADIEWADRHHQDLLLRITVGSAERTLFVPAGAKTIIGPVDVPGVERWWPAGHGAQPLYDLAVELSAKSTGERLDVVAKRIGFRTVTVNTTPEQIDAPFTVVVNGKPIFVNGVDWVPDDHFPGRITKGRLAVRVGQAVAAAVNLLRVRGDGSYESDDFYDVCDERGVLVWQDFPPSPAAQPKRQPGCAELAAEARENVARLMSHASLAMWNSGNENLWAFADRARSAHPCGQSWELGYHTDVLPGIVAELDPGRFYCHARSSR
ncbi:glycoside hydrolase family 2 protein [Amycolatopsis sp. NPDC059657]|uniref:glycoside hydrolase family 2 protein n=1 Tax=Amycolatopsis sp. NPDC059657 TaxID=3346899 RepID=UPI00366D6B45